MLKTISGKLGLSSNNDSSDLNNEDIQLKGGIAMDDQNKDSCMTRLKNFLISNIQVETSYIKFGVIFITGLGIIMLSLIFLPIILISPKKFSLLFALGTFVCLCSFLFYHGTNKFFELLFNKDRIWFTIIYLLGFIGCLFFPSIFGKNYFIILIFSGLEMISTLFFILTFIPGGYSSIKLFTSLFISQFKRLINN